MNNLPLNYCNFSITWVSSKFKINYCLPQVQTLYSIHLEKYWLSFIEINSNNCFQNWNFMKKLQRIVFKFLQLNLVFETKSFYFNQKILSERTTVFVSSNLREMVLLDVRLGFFISPDNCDWTVFAPNPFTIYLIFFRPFKTSPISQPIAFQFFLSKTKLYWLGLQFSRNDLFRFILHTKMLLKIQLIFAFSQKREN